MGHACHASLIASKAEQTLRFGTLTIPGRSVNMHPSPSTGVAHLAEPDCRAREAQGFFADSDGVCGNGVAWRVELVNRTGASQLAAGTFDNGKRSEYAPEAAVALQRGDLIKFVVNAGQQSCLRYHAGVFHAHGAGRRTARVECGEGVGGPHS